MKVSFSRKGYDSEYGKYPSIIHPSGDMLSFPIGADGEIGIESRRLRYSGTRLSELFQDLGHKETELIHHVDPDLGAYTIDGTTSKSCGVFGQDSQSASHLDNQGFSVGDMFLFFGTFQHTEIFNDKIRYVKESKPFHAIFGYLIVNDIIRDVDSLEIDWKNSRLRNHPHYYNRGTASYTMKNRMYVSHQYGFLNYSEILRLSVTDGNKSLWSLPKAFEGVEISLHSNRGEVKDDRFLLQTVGKGQEFVFTANSGIEKWISQIIGNRSRIES